ASVGEPARSDQVERDAELRVLVLGEDALAGRRFAPQEVGERAPVRAAFPEIDGERAQVEKEDCGESDHADDPRSARQKNCHGQGRERREREAGGEKPSRDVEVRMEMAEDLDREKSARSPRKKET